MADALSLSKDEILRYSRHLIMPEVGMDGQLKLKAAKVLLVGTGGLGSPMALYLTAAGIGTIGLVDFDVVDYTNLQRQVIHGTSDVGKPKIDSAIETMNEINPFVNVIRHEVALTSENAMDLVKDLGFRAVTELQWGESLRVGDLNVTARKVHHWGARTF